MKFVFVFFTALFVGALPARAQIERPLLGFVLDSHGALRPATGEPASATLGDPVDGNPAGSPAISFACSSKLCLVKTDGALVAFVPDRPAARQSVAAPGGVALIALDDPANSAAARGAWIYFQAAGQLARWQDGILDFADFVADGAMLSLRAAAGGFDYAVARDDGAWIEHYSASDGSVVIVDSAIIDSPGAAPAGMLFDGGILLSSTDKILLRRPDGGEMTFHLAGPKEFQGAGSGYVEIAAPDGLWLLRTHPGREQLVLLPGAGE